MNQHRQKCEQCEPHWLEVLVFVCGLFVAFLGHGSNAVAGAIVAVGMLLASAIQQWVDHQ